MYALDVLESLATAIDELRVPLEGVALVQVLAVRDRLDARIVSAVGDYDEARMWDADAATSMTAWLRDRASMTSAAARHLVSLAARLHELPVCSAAFADGTLSKGQVEVIVAKLDDATADLFAEAEAEMVPHLAPMSLSGCGRAMALWVQAQAPKQPEPERVLHLSETLDGRHLIDGHLDAEGGAVVSAALRLAMVDDPDRSPDELRADALVDVSRFFLDHQQGPHRWAGATPRQPGGRRGGGGGRPGRTGGGGLGRRRPDPVRVSVRLHPAPGADQGTLGCPRLRHRHPDHPRQPVERPRHPRRALPLPRL